VPGTWLPSGYPIPGSGERARFVCGVRPRGPGPLVRLGWGAFSALSFGDDRRRLLTAHGRSRWDGWCLCRLPSPNPLSPLPTTFLEGSMVVRNSSDARRALKEATRQAAKAAELDALPVNNPQAAGIDVGDQSHWVCVAATPDGSETVREFPAHSNNGSVDFGPGCEINQRVRASKLKPLTPGPSPRYAGARGEGAPRVRRCAPPPARPDTPRRRSRARQSGG
jgi:hypothetical protein